MYLWMMCILWLHILCTFQFMLRREDVVYCNALHVEETIYYNKLEVLLEQFIKGSRPDVCKV